MDFLGVPRIYDLLPEISHSFKGLRTLSTRNYVYRQKNKQTNKKTYTIIVSITYHRKTNIHFSPRSESKNTRQSKLFKITFYEYDLEFDVFVENHAHPDHLFWLPQDQNLYSKNLFTI